MNIKSNFKDYYDNAVCSLYCTSGLNSDRIYVRKSKEVLYSNPEYKRFFFMSDWTAFNKLYTTDNIKTAHTVIDSLTVIGFCDRIYYALKIKNKWYYNVDNLETEYALNLNDLERIKFTKKAKAKDKYYRHKAIGDSAIKELKDALKEFTDKESIIQDLFLSYKVPVFALKINNWQYRNSPIRLVLNPALKDYHFYKIFNPVQTYQEIEMYLNSKLLEVDQPKQITDNIVLLEAKGFDKVKSFRNI